jgi:peptidoglycan/xylan/chitin deacetylase (PgdA/CDA1 family)
MERSTRGTGVYVSQGWIGSNLADMGRERCVSTCFGVGNSWVGFDDRPGNGTPFFRPPYGVHNADIDRVAADLGYTTITM